MGAHDCIHKNCSELGQAVNEGDKSSSPAMSKLLHDSETPESNTVPAVQELLLLVVKVQNRIVADSLVTPDQAQSSISTENYSGTLTVWSVSGGSTICFSILFKTNFQSSFKTRFRTVFSQIFAETLKLE